MNFKKIFYKITPTWKSIRVLGELKILTKVSYISLVVVPIIAISWDGIQITKNKFNTFKDKEIKNLIEISQNQYNRINKKIKDYSLEDLENIQSINQCLANVETNLNSLKKANDEENKGNPLNKVWVRVFLCAIFIGLGHLVYQIWSPIEIQQHSLDSYINDKKSLFSEHGTQVDLMKAEAKVKGQDGKLILEEDESRINKLLNSVIRMNEVNKRKKVGELSYADLYQTREILLRKRDSRNLSDPEKKILGLINSKTKKVGEEDISSLNLSTIARAAEIDYKKTSIKFPFFIFLSGFFYGTGIWLLLLIVYSQVKFVLEVGGQDFIKYFY